MNRFAVPSILLSIAVTLNSAEAARAAGALPTWAQHAAAMTVSPPKDAVAHVLLNEGFIDIGADGRCITRERGVLRILSAEGRKFARATIQYTRPGDKVRDFNAWIQTADGTRRFGRKEVVDLALEPDALYSELRLAVLNGSDQAGVGSLWAWESTREEPPTIAEDEWRFQSEVPTAISRCIVRVPQGWTLAATVLNHAALVPQPSAEGQVWEIRDLPAWQTEPFAPAARPASARLHLTYAPPADAKNRPNLITFTNWAEVAAFGRAKFATALKADPAIHAKTTELCIRESTPWGKIRALTAYVQNLRYIGISINLQKLGGYVPHPAPAVLQCGYGDCKDKAALLSTMLADVGIASFPVFCFSGDRTAVAPALPSPTQFNHVFLAIVVDETVTSPFVVDLGVHGRGLLFDPTDTYTRVGDFPVYNQGNSVLVCTPGATVLHQVPFAPTANNLLRVSTVATIAVDGSLKGTLETTSFGGSASKSRELTDELAKERRTVSAWLQANIPGSNVEQAEMSEGSTDHARTLHATLSIPSYAQPIGRDLLAVRPLFVTPAVDGTVISKSRTQPLIIPPTCEEVVFEFSVPEGFRLKECGPFTRLEHSFGSYTVETTCVGGLVSFRRKLVLLPVDLPADKALDFRSFLDAARKRDKVPILLERL